MRTRIRAAIKGVLRRTLRSAGYEIGPSTSDFSDVQRDLIARCDLVVDVGANAGQYAERVRALGFTGPVLSFEPGAEAFSVLSSRSARVEGWTARRLALSDEVGTATLQVSRNSVSSSLLTIRSEHVSAAPASVTIAEESVAVSTVDIELEGAAGDRLWLKLDVQGAELAVLRGATETLGRTLVVQSELSLSPLYEEQTDLLELITMLRDSGFQLYHLQPGFTDPVTGQLLQMDGLFLRS